MTKYLISFPSGAMDVTPEELPAVADAAHAVVQEAKDAGVWVFAGGLMPRETATTVDATGTEPVVTDGPFAESKEYLGGFWIIEAADLDAALGWAERGSRACAGKVEVRPFQDEPEA